MKNKLRRYQTAGLKTNDDPIIQTNLAPNPVKDNSSNFGFNFDCDSGAGKSCRDRDGSPFRVGITGSLSGSKGFYGQPKNLGPGWDSSLGENVSNRIGTHQNFDMEGSLGGYARVDLPFGKDKNWNPMHLNLGYNRKQNFLEGTGSNNLTAKLAYSGDQFTGSPGHGGFFGNRGGSSRAGFSYGVQGNYNLDKQRVDNVGAFGRTGLMGPLGINGSAGIDPQTGKAKFGAGLSIKFENGGQRQVNENMMNNNSIYQQMKKLPGGVMKQIPGSNAVEFQGQTHKQGGILMDAETEVENGETMDKVTMSNGQDQDYFFSSYLKKGGQSYAEIHKEILARGGNQEEINYLAAVQEKAAKRNPNKIAKLGGLAMYATGGVKDGVSKREKKDFQKARYQYYEGNLSFKKWSKENPFNLEEYMSYMNPEDPTDNTPKTTEGLRQDLPGAYGYRADAGDGYTICQSGNCKDGTGVMYTYYAENLDENDSPVVAEGTVIAMYEGEFKDGKPVGKGVFTWNDVDASLADGVPFIPWSYSSTGEFKVDATGHPELVSGTKDWGDLGVSTGVFTDGNLVSGTVIKDSKMTNIEDGEETKKLSKTVRKNLVEKGLLEKIPFKYSQGDIKNKYTSMDDHSKYTQPTKSELNARGYNSFDEFRADYERYTDASYDWKNVKDWGKQHDDAWGELTEGIDAGFASTGSFATPTENLLSADASIEGSGPPIVGFNTAKKPCPCNPVLTADQEACDCPEDGEDNGEGKGRKGMFGFDNNSVPALAIGSGLAQMVPAAYAFTHKQPAPEQVPFESGVTSPIVPGRLRAKKLSHINMNKQRSANDSRLREMNQFIDTSGGGPATMANRMAAWGKKHEGDMQIAAQEKQANIGIENQNVAIENQTNLHNEKMQQEAALGNAQMQMSEAQRLNEVNAINTASRNKIKDDEEYMKYAGVIAASQGVGSMFSDMLAYKGDMNLAQGYSIEGTTNRMLLRRQLGRTIMIPGTRTPFCEDCTQEDIARYEKTYSSSATNQY